LATSFSLRSRLVFSYLGIVLVALTIAGATAIYSFNSAIQDQAQERVSVNMSVAQDLLADRIDGVATRVKDTTRDADFSSATESAQSVSSRMSVRAGLLDLTYLQFVSGDGAVTASSVNATTYATTWPLLREWAASGEASSGVVIVPADELENVGVAGRFGMEAKETDSGTLVAGEEDGALAIVAVAPYGDGVLLGVQVLKLNQDFVESVVNKVDGTATLFQHGVRVSTTVTNAEGERAIATVVSDKVRETTLQGGEPFRGEAFVVDRDYLTAYDPIVDPSGETIGMLYVGVDKKPFTDTVAGFALRYTAVIALALIAALVGAFNVSRSLSRPLGGVGSAAEKVSAGDLTVRVPSAGYTETKTLADAFNTMTGGLREIIAQTETSVQHLRSASAEISAASRNSAENASRQASGVAQTTATVEELMRTFQSIAAGASRVLDVAEDALEAAQTGQHSIDRTGSSIEDLAHGAKDVADAAVEMAEVAHDISEMTSLISGIAEQTKILALNAAIEAARAGAAGKGFAVVSSETRVLADSVAQSAAHIAKLVEGIQKSSDTLRTNAARQAEMAALSVRESHETRESFDAIVDQMSETARAAREINTAAGQQKVAAEQLVSAMHSVSTSATETASAAAQLAESSTCIEAEAETLMHGLSRFRLR